MKLRIAGNQAERHLARSVSQVLEDDAVGLLISLVMRNTQI